MEPLVSHTRTRSSHVCQVSCFVWSVTPQGSLLALTLHLCALTIVAWAGAGGQIYGYAINQCIQPSERPRSELPSPAETRLTGSRFPPKGWADSDTGTHRASACPNLN